MIRLLYAGPVSACFERVNDSPHYAPAPFEAYLDGEHRLTARTNVFSLFDLTPGTPEIYRRELLTKLFTVGYDVENNIMFGTDSMADDYNVDWVSGWIWRDNSIYRDLGVTEEAREKIYHANFERFLACEDVVHRIPEVNKKTAE